MKSFRMNPGLLMTKDELEKLCKENGLSYDSLVKGPTITVHLGPAGLPCTLTPQRLSLVKWKDKTVGYVKGVREEGTKLMADIVITDPEVLKQIEQPVTS